VSDADALTKGMAEKAKDFVVQGGEIYRRA
jgi:hypothetical protein